MQKIPIWGENIPYNIPDKKKADAMIIRKAPKPVAMMNWLKDIFGSKVAKDAGNLDTFTWLDEIQSGEVSAYFDDVPTLVPYIVDGADTAVIIAPGGGFCNQSREAEGYNIAEFLNKRGISAFVLEYRMNPYEPPVFYLDMQRAIRYVRHHAAEYGLHPQKIGAMGFSAGGYVTGAAAIFLQNKPVDVEGYTPDAVDAEDGLANFLGMIYPAASFEHNPNMLYLLEGDSAFQDGAYTEQMQKHSLTAHVTADCPPQFLCYGTKDPLKDIPFYEKRLKEIGADYESYVIDGASHGFSLSNPKHAHWADAFADWVIKAVNPAEAPVEEKITAFAMAAVPALPISQKKNNNSQLRAPLNVKGNGIVLRFSNQYGTTVGIIDHATVAVIKADEEPAFQDVTRNGRTMITIPAGAEVASDPLPMEIEPGMEILVNVFCKEKAKTVAGVGFLTRTSSKQGQDLTGSDFVKAPYSAMMEKLASQAPIQNVDYLKAVDVFTREQDHIVISCFGDSITAQNRWVYPLTKTLYRRYPGQVSVLNYGICGNRLLTDAPEKMPMFGAAGVERIDWDTLRDQGVTHMIMALGGNDIGMGSFQGSGTFTPDAEAFREGCLKLLEKAHARGIQVYALSIYPAQWDRKDPLPKNAIRLQYLEIQKEVFDGFIDIEDALKEGEAGYKAGYGYQDQCHLKKAGGKACAQVVYRTMRDIMKANHSGEQDGGNL